MNSPASEMPPFPRLEELGSAIFQAIRRMREAIAGRLYHLAATTAGRDARPFIKPCPAPVARATNHAQMPRQLCFAKVNR